MEDIRIRRFVKLIYCILFSGIGMFGMYGQTPSTITVVLDGDRGSNQFLELVQTEIDILLQDYDLTYTIKKLGELDQSP